MRASTSCDGMLTVGPLQNCQGFAGGMAISGSRSSGEDRIKTAQRLPPSGIQIARAGRQTTLLAHGSRRCRALVEKIARLLHV